MSKRSNSGCGFSSWPWRALVPNLRRWVSWGWLSGVKGLGIQRLQRLFTRVAAVDLGDFLRICPSNLKPYLVNPSQCWCTRQGGVVYNGALKRAPKGHQLKQSPESARSWEGTLIWTTTQVDLTLSTLIIKIQVPLFGSLKPDGSSICAGS